MACTLDFRFLDEGIGGQRNKRKRAAQDAAEAMEEDGGAAAAAELPTPPSKRSAVASAEDPNRPSAIGRPTYDGVIAGRVSGRNWKQPRQQRSSAMRVTRRGKSLEQRVKDKELKRAFQDRVKELKEEIRSNKVEKRRKREEREKKKKENILRTGTKLQKITNPKTLKKIAKSKQRKNLKLVDDSLVSKNKR
ncbi:coiled-coil protein [Wolffia australiana]